MPKRYAEAAMLVLFTAFYLPFYPLGIFISFLAIIINYWMDKYLLLRRFMKPPRISGKIALTTVNLMLLSIPLYIVTYIFYSPYKYKYLVLEYILHGIFRRFEFYCTYSSNSYHYYCGCFSSHLQNSIQEDK